MNVGKMREPEGGGGPGSVFLLDSVPLSHPDKLDAIGWAAQEPVERPVVVEPITREPRSGARRIGIVGNPRSHSYATIKDDGAALSSPFPLAEPATFDALRSTLSKFEASGVDLLVVQGGDGTLRDVLTALPETYGDHPPEVALLATGNTNLAARVFGSIEPGPCGLARLAAAAQQGVLRRTECRTLQVSWPGEPARTPLRGFFMGACLYAEGKMIADRKIHGSGVHHGAAVVLAAVSALAGALIRRTGSLRRGTWRRIALDDQPVREGAGFVFLATTLDRLMLGLWPFGSGGGSRAPIRWLDIDAPVRNLWRILLRILLRRDASATRPHHRAGRASRVALRLEGQFVLDGEFFEPGSGGIELSDGGPISFVCP